MKKINNHPNFSNSSLSFPLNKTLNNHTCAYFNSSTRWYEVNSGQIALMSQAEKDAILQAEEEARLEAQRQSVDRLEVTVKDVIIALVKRVNVRIPKNPITKAEVVQQIKEDLEL